MGDRGGGTAGGNRRDGRGSRKTDEAQETSSESSISTEEENNEASETETAKDEPAVVTEEDISTAGEVVKGDVTSTDTLTWTDTDVKSGNSYTYYIRGYNGSSLGSYTPKSIDY